MMSAVGRAVDEHRNHRRLCECGDERKTRRGAGGPTEEGDEDALVVRPILIQDESEQPAAFQRLEAAAHGVMGEHDFDAIALAETHPQAVDRMVFDFLGDDGERIAALGGEHGKQVEIAEVRGKNERALATPEHGLDDILALDGDELAEVVIRAAGQAQNFDIVDGEVAVHGVKNALSLIFGAFRQTAAERGQRVRATVADDGAINPAQPAAQAQRGRTGQAREAAGDSVKDQEQDEGHVYFLSIHQRSLPPQVQDSVSGLET